MTLKRYTKDTVTAYTLLRKFLLSNGRYVGFLRNLRNDLTIHLTKPFCAKGSLLPNIMHDTFLLNYVEYELINKGNGAYRLINDAFSWSSTDEGHGVWARMESKWYSFLLETDAKYE